MNDTFKKLIGDNHNFIFLGEAGSGKSEISINFAMLLAKIGDKPVHYFDMDMTKPLFRSRDVIQELESAGIIFHHEEQFMDAPTLVGGVNLLLRDETCYAVMDVGGDYIGARSIGGYAPRINKGNTIVYYVLNAYRPWSDDIEHIDETLGKILGVSHIELGRVHMVNNPNNGLTTTEKEFLDGNQKMADMVNPYITVDFACVREDLYDQVKDQAGVPVLPIHLYLTYPWLLDYQSQGEAPVPGRG
ncbi:Uncharacterised protein [uncultured Roseburia sp.]|uniref:CobQ/CobB/MinD/ParA nucleotide binding domain-containing protein n=1 Tax=Brotonthovivens ammoniilytica TaxID=2981725 RepID=A0ABT2THK0_9FIRM|nr:MinD/ParA family protein [Brotonthovivens ammoniilytica]MCU6761673.1 hypothetical protein [Brotonthovivens ammoniilytica]SCI43157.1 Uncharacterised protein [uncultured Roseburia sp.]